jgi:carboxyl-terminal processing protease
LDGPQGSSVRLKVLREGVKDPLEVVVERTDGELPPPSVTRPVPTVALLRVLSFKTKTLEQLAEQLESEWQARAFKGLIIDLRGSPGGQLATTAGLAAMFLKSGDVVGRSMSQDPEANFNFYVDPLETYVRSRSSPVLARFSEAIRAVPLVVLVDEATSGGAEFVAAAWQDHHRAVLMGRPTLGRGSLHTFKKLPGGGVVKYTSAHWLAPSGRAVEGIGVTPDRIVTEAEEPHIVDLAIKVLSDTR